MVCIHEILSITVLFLWQEDAPLEPIPYHAINSTIQKTIQIHAVPPPLSIKCSNVVLCIYSLRRADTPPQIPSVLPQKLTGCCSMISCTGSYSGQLIDNRKCKTREMPGCRGI